MHHHNNTGELGIISSIISLTFAFFSWITIKDVQLAITIAVGCISAVSGLLSILLLLRKLKKNK